MRWSNLHLVSAATVLVVSSSTLARPAPPGEPTAGAISIPVEAASSDVAEPAAHPGEQTLVLGRQETAATYNNGMYTPWSAETAAATASAVSIAAVPATDSSVYLQPSSDVQSIATAIASTTSIPAVPTTPPAVTPSTTPDSSIISDTASEVSIATSASDAESTSILAPTSIPSSISSSSSTPISSTSSSASSRASNTLAAAKAVPNSDSIEVGPSGPKMSMILPVALSLGILAVLLACLGLFVYRRRAAQRRRLNDRRYEGGDFEKGTFGYGAASEDDDMDEKGPSNWKTFQRNSVPYDDIPDGAAAGLAGRGAGSTHIGHEEQDSAERGWGWGAAVAPKQARRPLPHTPQQQYGATMAPSHTMSSLHEDLDAMIAQSRTGYDPYQARPKRENSFGNVATAVYSSLSGRSKRFGSKASSKSNGSARNKQGQWTEHGAWQDNDDASIYEEEENEPTRKSAKAPGTKEDGAPLLYTAIDDTPRKGGYSTYTPPDTPTRKDTPARHRTETDDSDVTVAGASTMQYSYTDDTPQHARRFTLRDNPVPQLSPSSPRRLRSKTVSSEGGGYDSPSCYSPSAYGHASPASQFPEVLQPGRSPALGHRAVSPPPSSHQHQSRLSPNPLAQSNKSGTTYSLTGMAGLLYSDGGQRSAPAAGGNSYTALPPRKPRKQSLLSKVQPRVARSPLSNEATASDSDSPNPHRAVSAVVRASRVRGNSIDSRSSEGGHWDQHVRGQLRESHSSTSSVDDLLTNILGPSRSPA